MHAILRRHKRLIVFATVGGTCFSVQYLLLTVLSALGVYAPVANAVGIAVSAQLNFVLSSRFTWGDRPSGSLGRYGVRLLAYNVTAMTALCVNTAVFTLAYRPLGLTAGAVLGVLGGMTFNYLGCNRLVFRAARRARPMREAAVSRLPVYELHR